MASTTSSSPAFINPNPAADEADLVKNVTKHPYFRGLSTRFAFDIAVLELEKCSPINDKIAPISMDKNIQPVSLADIKIASWGNRSDSFDLLRSETLQQLNSVDCLDRLPKQLWTYITHDKFCAAPRAGEVQLRLLKEDTGVGTGVGTVVEQDGSWFMTGVLFLRLKGEDGEGVFVLTKVSDYVDWIREFVHHAAEVRSSANGGPLGTCGRSEAGPTRLVQNGEKTPIEYVPWHAGIFLHEDGQRKNVCGGSLVSPCVVVTAAHCVSRVAKGEEVFVALGKYLSGWDSETNIHKTRVKNIIRHPYYFGEAGKLGYDIAVLELEKCSPLNNKIAPICIDKNIQPVSLADIKVAGWGNETTTLTELESVALTQLNYADCLKVMSDNGRQVAYITPDKFCATRKKGAPQSGLLQGDSGGAALVKQNGSWYLAGVVSARLKDGNNEDVYALTKVSEYVDWIREYIPKGQEVDSSTSNDIKEIPFDPFTKSGRGKL